MVFLDAMIQYHLVQSCKNIYVTNIMQDESLRILFLTHLALAMNG